MSTYAPNYYNKFKCISKACQHNCCIGWEIDIDNDTYNTYRKVGGDFGKKLSDGITVCEGVPSFRLTEKDERCVFLRGDNLCDIFCELGEDWLCQICRDHPRFRNFFESRTEIGLGLCCEEASRIILSEKEPFSLSQIEKDEKTYETDDFEKQFFDLRDDIFKLLQSKDFELQQKAEKFLSLCGADFPGKSYAFCSDLLVSLEKFDEDSKAQFAKIRQLDNLSERKFTSGFETEFSNLFTYFVYRHLPLIFEGYSLGQVARFIWFCFDTVFNLCLVRQIESGKLGFDNIAEFSRMFSCEVEYSDINIDLLLNLFE